MNTTPDLLDPALVYHRDTLAAGERVAIGGTTLARLADADQHHAAAYDRGDVMIVTAIPNVPGSPFTRDMLEAMIGNPDPDLDAHARAILNR